MTSEKHDNGEENAGSREPGDVDARIEKLKAKASMLSDGQMRSYVAPDIAPDVAEQFWKRVVAAEEAHENEEPPFDVLVRSGLTLPSPEELDDAQVTVKLWEVIREMASLRMFLSFTDHLSDRELYAHLWSDTLRVPAALGPDSAWAWQIDLSGCGGDEDHETFLKYYADDAERRSWAQEWPEDRMPDAAPLPFDRDRHLPAAW